MRATAVTASFTAMVCAVLALSGCDPVAPEDRAYFEEQAKRRGETLQTMRDASLGVSIEDVIKRVRQYPAHEGEGTMEDWVSRRIDEFGGELLFPRWEAHRGGSNIQEVSYEFILINTAGGMRRYLCMWEVDLLDMTVSEPSIEQRAGVESPEELLRKQHMRRVKHHEENVM